MQTPLKSNGVVRARSDAIGKATSSVYASISPVQGAPGQFTFENSEGDLRQGKNVAVALHFIKYDRALKAKGYTRMHFGNRSGDHVFDL